MRPTLLAALLSAAGAAFAEESAPPAAGPPSLMKALAARGLHDLEDESWNAYGQVTFIGS